MSCVKRGRADLQQKHSTNALNYGHLGTAAYLQVAKEWSFLRRPADPRLSRSAFPFISVKQEIVYPASSTSTWDHDRFLKETGTTRDLLKARPDRLGPASSIAGLEEPISAAIDTSVGATDPARSARLAFGSASWLLENDVRSGYATIPIVAFTSDDVSQSISFVQTGRDTVTVNDANDIEVTLKIAKLNTQNPTTWTSGGEAVQQLCFAAISGYQSTWMAARLTSSTIIFHPLIRKSPAVTPASGGNTGVEVSQLDANPVLVLPTSRTGGRPHADVCFHPLDCQMLAVVDQHGNWSIWNIEGKRSVTTRVLFRVHLLKSGKLYSWENLKRPENAPPHHDGWQRICWLANSSKKIDRVAVVNRRSAVLYAIADDVKHDIDLRLGRENEAQWILDIKPSARQQDRIFVLTSTRVLWISTADGDWRDESYEGQPTIICSWQHFRGREDTSLRLTMLEGPEGAIVLLSSRNNAVVNVYRVNTSPGGPSAPVSWFEPSLMSLLDVLQQSQMHGMAQPPLSILFAPLQLSLGQRSKRPSPTLSLHKIFALHADYSITEVLLRSFEKDLSDPFGQLSINTIPLPLREQLPNVSSRYAELEEVDDFVVSDTGNWLHAFPSMRELSDQFVIDSRCVEKVYNESTTDWQDIYQHLVEGQKPAFSNVPVIFAQYVQELWAKVKHAADAAPGVRLLLEASTRPPQISDVEECSGSLDSFLLEQGNGEQAQSICYNLRPTSTILDLYQRIVSDWLTPLPPHIPDRIRVNKERLARTVAVDVALSAIAVLPARRRVGDRSASEEIHDDFAPQAETSKNPDYDISPLTTLLASLPASFGRSEVESNPLLDRLRLYTPIMDTAIILPLPSSISDMLAHLPMDSNIDPSTYDWRSTEAAISARQDNENGDRNNVKARQKAEKIAQAKRRRLRMQYRNEGGTFFQEAPPAIGSSQMILPTRQVQSSQIMGPDTSMPDDHRPMTQPERGTFGTRIGGTGGKRKAKGKARAAGF